MVESGRISIIIRFLKLQFTGSSDVAMESIVHGAPVLTLAGIGSSTSRLYGTLDDVGDGGHGTRSVVTPVTQAALDPLMRKSLQTPWLSITPMTIETPPSGSYCQVCVLIFYCIFSFVAV
jgi:hypothetical protein